MGPPTHCALCKKAAQLRRSHIIPKFTHKRTKEMDGKLLIFSKTSHPEGDVAQDAFFEELLCSDCEALFQKWEDHAARMMNQKRVFDFPPTAPRQFVTLEGFDYSKLKLFLMSILWRMGAAKQRAFSPVQLGPHLERIGGMLLARDPGEVTDYGCALTVVHLEGERIALTRPADSVMYETQNLRMYRALVDGLLFAWIVGSRTHMSAFQAAPLLLQKDGRWTTYSREWQDLDFVRKELGLLASGKIGRE